MTARALTERQQAILAAVHRFTTERRLSPTLREIGKAVGLSSISTVQHHVTRLVARGVLERVADSPRSLAVTAEGRALAEGSAS